MSWSRLFARYGWTIGVREWEQCSRIRPEVRLGTAAVAGAVIAPFVVFVSPIARLYWLMTGRRLPRPVGWFFPPPRIMVNPFGAYEGPPEIRALLGRPEFRWEPGPEEVPQWLRAWGFLAQILRWEIPPRDIARSRRQHTGHVTG